MVSAPPLPLSEVLGLVGALLYQCKYDYELCILVHPKRVKDNAIALTVTIPSLVPLQSFKCFFISVDLITVLFATIASIPEHKEAVNSIHCAILNLQPANHSHPIHCFKLI